MKESHDKCKMILKIVQYFLGMLLLVLPLIDCGPVASRSSAAAGTTTYDQKQTGKYNIHLNIKDVAIIAVGSEDLSGGIGDAGSFYEDYYDYDLDDFTINPVSATLGVTTKKPKPYNVSTIEFTTAPTTTIVATAAAEGDDLISFVLSSQTEQAKPANNSAPSVDNSKKPDLEAGNEQVATVKPLASSVFLPTIKPIANKTQSVVILSDEPLDESSSLFNSNKTTNVEITTTSTKPAYITSTPILFGSSSSPTVPAFNANSVLSNDEGQIPVHIIMEPLLQPKPRPPANTPAHRANHRVYKHGAVGGPSAVGQHSHSKINGAGRGKQRRNTYNEDGRRRCGRNQVLDRHGRCQSRRTGL